MNGMKTIVCRKPGELALEERPLPERGADEVLIRIRRIGICGTDFHIFEGLHPYLQYPRIMGHELSAEVLEAPQGSAYRPGDPVIVIPYLSCGTCVACRKGKTNCCTTLACLGVHCDGGMAERIALPERNLMPARRAHPGTGRHGRIPRHRRARRAPCPHRSGRPCLGGRRRPDRHRRRPFCPNCRGRGHADGPRPGYPRPRRHDHRHRLHHRR